VFSKMLCLADVIWAVLLVVVSDDAITSFLFLFPILVAAFQWSFAATLCLTITSVALLITIGLLGDLGEDLLLPELLLPPTYLLVFGYLLARWGDREMASKRRLVLLKEITKLSNPRFGIDRMIGLLMERLRAFYDVEACLMIVIDVANNEYMLRRADRHEPERAIRGLPIPAETAQLLLAPASDQAIIYSGAQRSWEWWSSGSNYYIYDIRESQRIAPVGAINDMLITIVDAASFVSLPLYGSHSTIGRLYLTATRRRRFIPADVTFLLQVMEQIVPVIENIRLVDQLASNAAEQERRRLARDIHDNVIQPYIGFQIGLAAVSQKLHAGDSNITNDIAQLIAITDQGIGALRSYIHQLPGSGERENVLLAAVRRFVATFTEATHIAVRIEVAVDLYINDRLAAEVFQMIVEGLSNIRRHTHAEFISIELAGQNDYLILRIVNDGADAAAPAHFIPRSIMERATSLGGRVLVDRLAGGTTQVTVEIPL
jgi:signal transduction histidine kinase